jgi:4-diphosphocytidyl-2-C-methyl-D-erythritol kinase
MLLLKPQFGVASGWAYSRWQHSRALPGISYEAQSFGGLKLMNDLECPVFEKFIFLGELKTWLLKQSEIAAALMSGSGSTVFAILRDRANSKSLADRAREQLDREMWTCACETIA